MRISIEIEGAVVSGTLEDSEAARNFASLLPLSLPFEDYAATEKISDLPKPAARPPVSPPKVGDLAYYAPWGSLAIFHKDFRYSSGLVRLGTLDSGCELLRRPGSYEATIRKLERWPRRPADDIAAGRVATMPRRHGWAAAWLPPSGG